MFDRPCLSKIEYPYRMQHYGVEAYPALAAFSGTGWHDDSDCVLDCRIASICNSYSSMACQSR